MAKDESKSLAIVDPKAATALATVDYGDDAGGGFENTTQGDFKMPWLRVLDAKSKQVETVEGAKAGKLINTVTSALFDSVLFIPAITEAWYVEWKPRAEGGGGGQGFVAVHKPESKLVQDALAAQAKAGGKFQKGADGKVILPKSPAGNDLVETYYVHGVQVNEETGDCIPAIMAFSSTHIPVYQSWLTTARLETTVGKDGKRVSKPLYAHAYRIGSTKVQKNGNTWYIPSFAFVNGTAAASLLDPKSTLFEAARNVRSMVAQGAVQVDHAGAGQTEGAAGKSSSEDVPF